VTLWIGVGALEISYGQRCCGPNCPSNPTNCSNTVLEWNDIELNTSYPCSTYADKTAKFYFVAEDEQAYTYETSIAAGDYLDSDDSIQFEKADINIEYIAGNNTYTPGYAVDFKVRTYDKDNESYVFSRPTDEHPLIYFNVTTAEGDMDSFVEVNNTRTDGSGFANVSFTPDGRFVSGNQTWRGYLHSSDLCYVYNESDNFTVEIDINWPPEYVNMTVNNEYTDSKGWGGGWNFSVEVRDYPGEGGDVNVTLQMDTNNGWRNISTQTCAACSAWEQLNFTDIQLNCSDINTSARFRFNVTDDYGNENGTGVYRTFEIKPDDVVFSHILGNNTIANRTGSQIDNLTLRLYDPVNLTYLPSGANATIWVSWNYYAYDEGVNLQSNATGHINREFDPICDDEGTYEYEARNQIWYAQMNSTDTCYYANQSEIFVLDVKGNLNITVIKPDGSNNYTWGESIFMQGQVKDDCGNTLDYSDVEFNMTVGNYEYSFTPTGLGGGFYQDDWDSTNASEGWYNVTLWANKTYQPDTTRSYYYPNQTVIVPPDTFYLFTIPLLKSANVSLRTDGWGLLYNFTVNVTDEAGDNVTVTFETKKFGIDFSQVGSSQNCTSCTNYTFTWNSTYTCADISGNPTWYFRFKGIDDDTNEHTTSTSTSGDYIGDDDTYVLEKDDVEILYVSGNESIVNRSSGNVTFVLFVNDTDREIAVQDSEATIYLNVTTNTTQTNSVNLTEANNQTNGTGYSYLTFGPDGNCNYEVGK
ncbi:MAG: hypothetical protein KAS32_29920, partial [Candidatus Peribacteraceae bacterium]|nr:hypothetical protein [Candidatus Peribacteraceae bacterium]